MTVKLIQQLSLLTFLVYLASPSIGQPPLAYLAFPFLYFDVFWLGINLGFLLLLDNMEDRLGWMPVAAVYFLGTVAGNLGLFFGGTAFGMGGGSAGVLALFGMFAVRNPYELALAEFVPAPAFLCISVMLLVRLLFTGVLDVLPLLVGVGLGLFFQDQAAAFSRPAWMRR